MYTRTHTESRNRNWKIEIDFLLPFTLAFKAWMLMIVLDILNFGTGYWQSMVLLVLAVIIKDATLYYKKTWTWDRSQTRRW